MFNFHSIHFYTFLSLKKMETLEKGHFYPEVFIFCMNEHDELCITMGIKELLHAFLVAENVDKLMKSKLVRV